MTDLRMTIAPKSDQLNSDDLIGRTMTIKVTKVSLCAEADQPIAINFEGDSEKPFKPCKSMRRVLVNVWGPDGNTYTGRSMTLYRDDKVQFGGLAVGGIRISHMSHIDKDVTMALTATRANRKPFTVKPLVVAPTTKPRVSLDGWIRDSFPALLADCVSAQDVEALQAGKVYSAAAAKASDEQKQEMLAIVTKRLDAIASAEDDFTDGCRVHEESEPDLAPETQEVE